MFRHRGAIFTEFSRTHEYKLRTLIWALNRPHYDDLNITDVKYMKETKYSARTAIHRYIDSDTT
jgi:hypothetical protein